MPQYFPEDVWVESREQAEADAQFLAGQLVTVTGAGPQLALGMALFRMREFQEAIQTFDDVEEQWKGTDGEFAASNNRGVCLLELKRLHAAEQAFRIAADHPVARKHALANLARVKAVQKDWPAAERILADAQAEFPEDQSFSQLWGQLRADRDRGVQVVTDRNGGQGSAQVARISTHKKRRTPARSRRSGKRKRR